MIEELDLVDRGVVIEDDPMEIRPISKPSSKNQEDTSKTEIRQISRKKSTRRGGKQAEERKKRGIYAIRIAPVRGWMSSRLGRTFAFLSLLSLITEVRGQPHYIVPQKMVEEVIAILLLGIAIGCVLGVLTLSKWSQWRKNCQLKSSKAQSASAPEEIKAPIDIHQYLKDLCTHNAKSPGTPLLHPFTHTLPCLKSNSSAFASVVTSTYPTAELGIPPSSTSLVQDRLNDNSSMIRDSSLEEECARDGG
uniref:Uncharacterized protein n=1 Tax=Ditylenchus dipsaci TaxID=166011 RepID=A0A915D8A3_9BILA